MTNHTDLYSVAGAAVGAGFAFNVVCAQHGPFAALAASALAAPFAWAATRFLVAALLWAVLPFSVTDASGRELGVLASKRQVLVDAWRWLRPRRESNARPSA